MQKKWISSPPLSNYFCEDRQIYLALIVCDTLIFFLKNHWQLTITINKQEIKQIISIKLPTNLQKYLDIRKIECIIGTLVQGRIAHALEKKMKGVI